MSQLNVSLIVWAKSQDSVHKPTIFEETGEPKRIELRSSCLPACSGSFRVASVWGLRFVVDSEGLRFVVDNEGLHFVVDNEGLRFVVDSEGLRFVVDSEGGALWPMFPQPCGTPVLFARQMLIAAYCLPNRLDR